MVHTLLSAARRLTRAGGVFLINAIARPFPGPGPAATPSTESSLATASTAFSEAATQHTSRHQTKTKKDKSGSTSLMDEWKWRCPPDPTNTLGYLGWRVISRVWRGHPEMSYGRVPPEEQTTTLPASRPGAANGASLFIRATAA